MCGIAGFVFRKPVEDTAESTRVLRRMTSVIKHRGPDGCGVYQDEYAFLGHRRLSIIDVAGGHQPMTNETRAMWITYNGEIFNHASVRPDLERAGHQYVSRCDTETILHAFEEYGPKCLDRFRGMFAFAIWDANTRTLFCARDRLGIKPFYYYWDGRVFVFASEIKAILEHPTVHAEFEDELLPEYLAFGYVSEERTLFRNIRRLMPGHHLRFAADSEKGPVIEQYWDVPPSPDQPESRSDEEWVRDCRKRLEETVQMRLMSDVPLGMFLSGGVDSSAIAALIKRMASGPVKTFSVGYAEEAYSELSYARQVAEAIGTDHHETRVSMDDFFNMLPKLIWHEDEPIAWPSSVSLYFVSKLASERVKVVLTGEGSDELFAGYDRYRHYIFNTKWGNRYGAVVPSGLRRLVQSQIASSSLLSATVRRKVQHTFLGRDLTLESLQLDNLYCAFSESEQQGLLRPASNCNGIYRNFRSYYDARPEQSELSRMLYADQKTYLVELLMKQDQMSMASSIESRVPFLDHEFVEFSTRVPLPMKSRGNTGKYILKKAVEDLLPHDIIYRKKMGFPTPLRAWLQNQRAEPLLALLRAPDSIVSEYIRPEAVQSLIQKQIEGVEDATDRIWRLLNLQIWGKIFLEGDRNARFGELMGQSAMHAI
jgi:asparagine synthase (glutamine-hydrolysing)